MRTLLTALLVWTSFHCSAQCPYDLNRDGVIDTDDLLFLLGNFGCTSCDDLDLDGGGILGVGDILILLGLL